MADFFVFVLKDTGGNVARDLSLVLLLKAFTREGMSMRERGQCSNMVVVSSLLLVMMIRKSTRRIRGVVLYEEEY